MLFDRRHLLQAALAGGIAVPLRAQNYGAAAKPADFPPVDSGLLNDRSTEEGIERGEDQPNRCSTTAVVKLRPFRSR